MCDILSRPGIYKAISPIINEGQSADRAVLEGRWNMSMADAAAVIASAEDDLDDGDESIPVEELSVNPCKDGHVNGELLTYALVDGNGIYCARVCRRCEAYHRRKFRPEVMDGPYGSEEVSEPIDPE